MSNLIRGGFDKLRAWIDLNAKDYPLFTIYPDESKTSASYVLASNTDTASPSLINTIEHLKQFFEINENGLFHLRFRKAIDGKANNGGLSVNFMYQVSPSTPSIQAQAPNPFISGIAGLREGEHFEDFITRKAQETFKTYLLEKELTDLKEENKQLKKELKEAESKNGERMDKVISIVAPALSGFLNKPQQKPTIGMQDTTPQTTTDIQARWETVVDYFNQKVPQGIEHLELLMKLHANNPSMYAQGLGMIKNLV